MRKIINDGVEASTKNSQACFHIILSLMLGKPRIRLNNLKTSLRFPCLSLNPIIDSISLRQIVFEYLLVDLKQLTVVISNTDILQYF